MGKKRELFDENGNMRPVFLHEDHKKPSNRREFLASGLLGFSGFMFTPSILAVLAKPEFAMAADPSCAAVNAVSLPAFVNINLSGGAAMGGNYLPLDAGGNLLASYDVLGAGATPNTEMEFGKVLFSGFPTGSTRLGSQLLAGIRTAASATTLANSSFLAACAPLQDDSNTNQIDITGLVTKAGLQGALLPKLGTRESITGVSNMPCLVTPPAPLTVNGIADVTNALAPSGNLATQLTAPQRSNLLRLVNNLSASQGRTIASANSSSGTALNKLVQCATDKNVVLANSTNPGVDPRVDTSSNVSTLWGMGTGGQQFGRSQNDRLVMGAMVYNALKGNAGAIGLEIGGYDYHGQDRIGTTDVMDNSAGQLIGKVLETAAAMQKKVFIHVTSDGAVGAQGGSTATDNFTGDRGAGNVSYMIMYDPAARPALKSATQYQLGCFNNSQGAVESTIAGSAVLAGTAAFANYLQFAGQIELYTQVTGNSSTDGTRDKLVKLA